MSIPVPSYIVEMSRAEELFPLNAKNPSPWETCRTHFIKRSLICLVLTILLALGSSALACYAVLNHNWCVLGISLSITISSILIALLLAFPIKNKVYGITLIDEISQDINNVGAQTLQSFEEVFKQLHHTQLPELRELHLSLVEKRQKNTQKQNKIKDLQKTLGSFPLTTYTQASPCPSPSKEPVVTTQFSPPPPPRKHLLLHLLLHFLKKLRFRNLLLLNRLALSHNLRKPQHLRLKVPPPLLPPKFLRPLALLNPLALHNLLLNLSLFLPPYPHHQLLLLSLPIIHHLFL